MGQQLNIKSDEAYALASELSEITGESLTAAVTTALRERLDRTRRSQGVDERVAEIKAIAADIRAHMKHPLPTSDHSWLYDEDGLPK